jgi:hypothetical protein
VAIVIPENSAVCVFGDGRLVYEISAWCESGRTPFKRVCLPIVSLSALDKEPCDVDLETAKDTEP